MRIFYISCLICLALTGCELYEPTWTTPNRLQVMEDRFYEAHDVGALDADSVAAMAALYAKHGNDNINVTVTYAPTDQGFRAMHATNEAARVAGLFAHHGVKGITTSIMPAPETPRKVLISFSMYSAEGPANCGTMPGFKGEDGLQRNDDYQLGCTVETLLASQVAYPADLLGQDSMPTTRDGRRVGNAAEFYRDGVPNERLEGERASGDD